MTSRALQVVQQRTVHLGKWHMDLIVVQTEDGSLYYPIRYLCAALGITPRFQVDRLREHAVLSKFVMQLPVQTSGGRQTAWCIHKRGIGFWLGGLQLDRVRASIRPKLLEWQEELVRLADIAFFGTVDAIAVTRKEFEALQSEVDGNLRFTLALEQRMGEVEERIIVPTSDEA